MPLDGTTNRLPPRRGLMLILSSPSGAGKTTLTRMLLQKEDIDLTLSVSVTTRPRRMSEVDGVHYHFITPDRFIELRDSGQLLEWAEVHGNFYGTPKGPVDALLSQGRDVLFDIDYQGTQQILARARDDVATIFILPPSMRELRARLERRAEDKAEVIARRLTAARHEITRWTIYDYVLINDDLQRTLSDVVTVLSAERLRRLRTEPSVSAFVGVLASEG
ncbi:MAG: guanylate kinase [Janthinobacterium lividum]